MRKYRKVKERKIASHKRKRKALRRKLRSGSSCVKKILLERYPHCDICGTTKNLQLHHVYLIRHGFKTELEHCVLLCAVCHHDWHVKNDQYWDALYAKDPNTDFMHMYKLSRFW